MAFGIHKITIFKNLKIHEEKRKILVHVFFTSPSSVDRVQKRKKFKNESFIKTGVPRIV